MLSSRRRVRLVAAVSLAALLTTGCVVYWKRNMPPGPEPTICESSEAFESHARSVCESAGAGNATNVVYRQGKMCRADCEYGGHVLFDCRERE